VPPRPVAAAYHKWAVLMWSGSEANAEPVVGDTTEPNPARIEHCAIVAILFSSCGAGTHIAPAAGSVFRAPWTVIHVTRLRRVLFVLIRGSKETGVLKLLRRKFDTIYNLERQSWLPEYFIRQGGGRI